MSPRSDSLPRMIRSTRALRRIVLLGAILTLLAATASATAIASAEGTTTVIHFQSEGLPALEAQLGHHEVHALTFHPSPAPGHVHVSMNDGKHYTVIYSASEQEHLIVLARANGARYAVATVKAKPGKATHHTLRYVAAGIVVVVVVVVVAVLLVDRRRKLNEEAAGTPPTQDQPSQ